MRLVLAQAWGGYGGGIIAILGLIVLAALLVAVAGVVVAIWRHANRPGSLIWRPILLWFVGVLGALYGILWLAYLIMAGDETIDKWVSAGALVAVIGLLPCVFVEWTRPGWGAGCVAILATLFGGALMFMSSPSPRAYSFTVYGLAIGVLLPMWMAALGVWCTVPRRNRLRYTTRELLLAISVGSACLGTLSAAVRNAYLAESRERWLVEQLKQETDDRRAEALAKLDELVQAAGGSDDRAFALAKSQFLQLFSSSGDPLLSMEAGAGAISLMLDRMEASNSTQVRKRMLDLLASPEMWKQWRPLPAETSRVVAMIRNPNEQLDVRREATQVLLNWGNWQAVASVLSKLPDRTKIGPAIVDFIVAASAEPDEQYRFRAVAQGSPQVVYMLPVLLPFREDSLPALIALLEHPCPWSETVEAAAQMVGNLGPLGEPALPALQSASQSGHPGLSRYARRSIESIEQVGSKINRTKESRNRATHVAPDSSETDGLPDLEVVEVFLFKGNYLRARVRNNGAAPAAGVQVRFVADDIESFSGPKTLDPGELGLATSTRRRPGTHIVQVTVDPDDIVLEADESNNTMKASLTWRED